MQSINRGAAHIQYSLWILLYTLFLVVLQALWIARLSYTAMRADLLLPLMLGVATVWSAPASLAWAFVWGFVLDVLSGKFWGFHVGAYVVAVCLVNATSEKIELENPIYQMLFVGVCALGQSIVLGFFLLLEPYSLVDVALIWKDLIIRCLFIMLLSPFVIYPVREIGRAGD